MKFTKLFFLIVLILTFVGFTSHKFYVSTTHIEYVDKSKQFQIIIRIYINDIKEVLTNSVDKNSNSKLNDTVIKNYILNKFSIKVGNQILSLKFIGKEYDNDIIKCYFESEPIKKSKIKSLLITNSILTEVFKEQKNITHLSYNKTINTLYFYKQKTTKSINLK